MILHPHQKTVLTTHKSGRLRKVVREEKYNRNNMRT